MIIGKIKRLLNRCDNCWKKAERLFILPNLEDIHDKTKSEEEIRDVHFYYCWDHAVTSGFCVSCGGFFAGTESFDICPKIQGFCDDCADELESDMGWGDYDDDVDYYYDYEYNFDEKQPSTQSLETSK